MAKGYSLDLRTRVIASLAEGDSAREAARRLKIGASTAIRSVQRFTSTGSVAALPGTGHARSPLEAHKDWLIAPVKAEPDMTLAEIQARLIEVKADKAGIGSIWRF